MDLLLVNSKQEYDEIIAFSAKVMRLFLTFAQIIDLDHYEPD